MSRAIFLGVTSAVPLWQTVTLPVHRTAPTVRACLGPQTEPSLWLRLDFVADQWDLRGQTDCILLCMLLKTQFGCTAPHLYFTCLNPDEDRDSGERSSRGRVFQVQVNVCSDFIQHFTGAKKKKSCFLLLPDDL